jgi:uncharacterized membrane protein
VSEGLVVLYALIGWTAVLSLVAIVLRIRRGRPSAVDVEMDELRAAYARGDITPREYARRRAELETAGGSPAPPPHARHR